MDLRTGDPILENGDYIAVEDDYAFYQIITNLFHCQTGSEIFNIFYGFDLENAIRLNSGGSAPKVMESLVAQALNPNLERLIYVIDYIEAKRDGQEMNISFTVQSRLGTLASLIETIGVG